MFELADPPSIVGTSHPSALFLLDGPRLEPNCTTSLLTDTPEGEDVVVVIVVVVVVAVCFRPVSSRICLDFKSTSLSLPASVGKTKAHPSQRGNQCAGRDGNSLFRGRKKPLSRSDNGYPSSARSFSLPAASLARECSQTSERPTVLLRICGAFRVPLQLLTLVLAESRKSLRARSMVWRAAMLLSLHKLQYTTAVHEETPHEGYLLTIGHGNWKFVFLCSRAVFSRRCSQR